MRPAEIDLRIDELVLHGFAAGDRRRLGQAVERELSRLLEEGVAGGEIPRALTTDGALAFGDGGVIHLAAGSGPEAAGAQVARAVYRAISGVGPSRSASVGAASVASAVEAGSAATPSNVHLGAALPRGASR
jgi:hypothetical protein